MDKLRPAQSTRTKQKRVWTPEVKTYRFNTTALFLKNGRQNKGPGACARAWGVTWSFISKLENGALKQGRCPIFAPSVMGVFDPKRLVG